MNHWQEIRALWRAAPERPVASRDTLRALRRHFHEPAVIERMAAFNDFVRQTDRRPHALGASDCSLLVADWCVENGHDDPASGWRGTYTTEAEYRALMAGQGDLVAVVAACAGTAGLKTIAEPEFGCVAVIGSSHNPSRQWSAIWNGCRWAVRMQDAAGGRWVAMSAKALGMWSVQCQN